MRMKIAWSDTVTCIKIPILHINLKNIPHAMRIYFWPNQSNIRRMLIVVWNVPNKQYNGAIQMRIFMHIKQFNEFVILDWNFKTAHPSFLFAISITHSLAHSHTFTFSSKWNPIHVIHHSSAFTLSIIKYDSAWWIGVTSKFMCAPNWCDRKTNSVSLPVLQYILCIVQIVSDRFELSMKIIEICLQFHTEEIFLW